MGLSISSPDGQIKVNVEYRQIISIADLEDGTYVRTSQSSYGVVKNRSLEDIKALVIPPVILEAIAFFEKQGEAKYPFAIVFTEKEESDERENY